MMNQLWRYIPRFLHPQLKHKETKQTNYQQQQKQQQQQQEEQQGLLLILRKHWKQTDKNT